MRTLPPASRLWPSRRAWWAPAAALTLGCSPDTGLKVNNTPPEASILSHADGEELLEDSIVTFRGKGSDVDDSDAALEATFTASGAPLCDWASLGEDGSVSCEALVPLASELSDERWSIELEVRDDAGAKGFASVGLAVLSTDAPTVTILSPEDGAVAYADRPVSLLGHAADDRDAADAILASWESSLDGVLAVDSFDSNGEHALSVTLSAGIHDIRLTATDTADKSAATAIELQVFDTNTAPSCTFTAPEDGASGRPDEPTTVTVTASDAEDAASALLVSVSSDRDGLLVEELADSSGRLSTELSGLSVGTHQLTLTVDDTGGATCTDTLTYTIGTAPVIADLAPEDEAVVNEGETTTFSASITDGEDAATDLSVVWSSDLDGVLWTDPPDASGLSTFSTAALSRGDHTITVQATDLDGQGSERDFALRVNGLPGAPEVSLSPDPARTDDALVAAVDVASTDPEGDTVTYSYQWDVGGVPSSASTSATLPASATAKGELWTVTVTPDDGHGAGTPASASLTIDNTAPVLASVSLSPTAPTAADTLTCTPGTITDADGDTAITTTTSWTVDGTVISATTSTLSSAWFSRGDDVSCTVTPDDGTDAGASVSSATVTVQNSAPAISSVSISPSAATADDTLSCSYSGFTDADGDADASSIEWTIGGTVVGTAATLSGVFSSGDTVVCTVTPDDGTDTGTAVSDSITVDNTAPSISSVSISPAAPTVSDTLTCSYSGYTDADGDPDASTYAWTVDGSPVGSSATLSGVFSRGDTVACTVTPDDGTDTGTPLTDAVSVANTAPVLAAVSLSPTSPTEGDTLTCTPGTTTDADGDSVSTSFAWTVDGTAVSPTGSTLDDSYWSKGQDVTCTVTPTDGFDAGTAVDSNTVTIGNAAPSIASVSITPSSPTVSDDLSCSYTGFSDPDGDTDQSTVAWTVNGVSAGTSTSLSASAFTTSDTVVCTVTPDDGTDTGTPVSASVSVGNSAPSISSVSITPTTAQAGDTLTCTYSGYTDADGDPDASTIAWTINGSAAGTATTLSSGFAHGDSVACTVTPSDGTSTGTPLSDSITVDNTAPSIASVSISPSAPSASDSLTCSYSGFADADGETDQSTTAWTVNGSPAGTGTTLSSSLTAARDSVTCTVTPDDGTDTGTPVSDSVTIQNTAPVLTSVTVTPTSPTVADTLTCSASATDADGDSVSFSYAWTVGATTLGTSSTLSSGFSKGDTVVCTVTPSDGTDTGSSDTDSVTIDNTAPVLASVALTPTTATEGDTLSCTPGSASDADGDSITYSYEWYVDSVQVAPTSTTLGDTFWDRGEDVRCEVTPSDGTDDGTTVVSNTVTISNSAPSISSVSISPSSPSSSDTLTCSYSGFADADGDADVSTFSWTIGGTEVGTSSTLSSSATSPGDTVVCTVTPNDGTDTGTAASDSVTIQNTAPVISSVSISPSSPTVADTLTCSASATDADGDTVSISYEWSVASTTVGTSSTLSSGFSKGDTVVCTATPSDGTDTGSSDTDSVTIDNTAPVLAAVTLTPTTATEGDTLSCTPGSASDADGDSVTYSYEWYVDSVQVAPTSTTLGDTFWDRGEDVRCEVTPTDGTDDGTTVVSNTVTIGNSAPSISSVSISPSSPSSSDTLTCSYSGYADADGDADASTFSWTIGGTEVGTSSTLSSSTTSPGDTVVCTVTPNDGTDTGTAASDSVTIQNTAPVLTSVSVTPNTPTVADTLSCSATATDADGDTVTFNYNWSIGTTTVGTASTLSSAFSRGDTVVCTVTPFDGTAYGTSGSDSELIENSAPSLSAVTLAPSSPVYASTLTAGYTTSDADGDSVSVSHDWYVNGVLTSTSSSLSVASSAVKGDSIYVALTPTDGFDSGSTVNSSTVTVGNTAPTTPTIDATDDPEVGVDDIVCSITSASTDVDTADSVSYVIEWEADGLVFPDDYGSATGPDTTTITDDTVPAADTSLATDWTCYVTATDGTDDSAEVSDTATVVAASSSLDTTRQGYTYATTGSYTSNAPNFALLEPYTFSSAATVTGFGVNWAFGYCTTCDFAVYDSAGASATLYGELSTSSCGTTSGGNNEVSGASISVPAGARGLGYNFASCNYGSTYYIADGGSSTSNTYYYRSYTAGSGLPDPFGSSTSTSIKVLSVYPIGY